MDEIEQIKLMFNTVCDRMDTIVDRVIKAQQVDHATERAFILSVFNAGVSAGQGKSVVTDAEAIAAEDAPGTALSSAGLAGSFGFALAFDNGYREGLIEGKKLENEAWNAARAEEQDKLWPLWPKAPVYDSLNTEDGIILWKAQSFAKAQSFLNGAEPGITPRRVWMTTLLGLSGEEGLRCYHCIKESRQCGECYEAQRGADNHKRW